MIVVLTGGGGGARLVDGLSGLLDPGELMVVANTGDDFVHLGLEISPDVDTLMYTLAGLVDRERGWGLAGETWNMMASLERLSGDTWFRLGDRDLGVHFERTRRRAAGERLSSITADFGRRLGIGQQIVPMSDDPVRTIVDTEAGPLGFQDYFVRLQCAPAVSGVRFEGAGSAAPSEAVLNALASPATEAIIIGPSNPYLSIDPILAMPALRAALAAASAPVVAVSPIIGGKAVKGPSAKIMAELGLVPSAHTVAGHYGDLLDGFVIDQADRGSMLPTDLRTLAIDTMMSDDAARRCVAHETLAFARGL